MRDSLTEILRVGKISSIDPDNCTAKVVFEDRSDIVSGDLHLIVSFTMADKAYYMPTIDERVLVAFNPIAPSTGYILGSFYADVRKPPFGDKNKAYIKFQDETLFEYDKELHKLTVDIKGNDLSMDIKSTGDANVSIKGKVKVEFKDDVTANIKGKAKVHFEDEVIANIKDKVRVEFDDDVVFTSIKNITLSGKDSSITV